ncbi:MAG TPA: winged helix-turn-helix domain-containing protein [Terriglobales bacterium]|nr:winged helix-turn-helix domain-containing protein [Terriglobales bacterium]
MDGEFQLGEWVISPKLNSFHKNGQTVHLEPKVMQVLVCLAQTKDVVSKEKLMRTVWADTFVTDDVLTRSISELRKVFADSPKDPHFIQTIPKGGYRLLVSPQTMKAPAATPASLPQPELLLEEPKRNLLPIFLIAGLALLLLAYAVGRHNSSAVVPAGRKTLAVLPFQNLSDDPQQGFFADGLTAEMISQFGRLPSDQLSVIAWSSMIRYKGTHKNEDQIGWELGATYLLDGSVRRSGNQVRITAELLQTGKRAHIWSNSYDGNLEDVLALQNRVAREIAQEIRLQLSPQDEARFATPTPVNGQGYAVYLRAKMEPEAMLAGAPSKVERLQQAIRLNPGYAPQYVEIAMSYRDMASRGFAEPKTSYAAGRAALARALQLDPESSGAHRELAWIEWRYEWNFPEADREFRRAIELNPNDSISRETYSLFLKSMGRYEEALSQLNRAIELSPMASFSRANAGSLLAMMKHYDAAMVEFAKATEIDPQQPYVWERLGPVLLMQGKNEQAITALEKARDYSGGQQDKLAWLGYAYAVSGRTADAEKVLELLKDLAAQKKYVSPLHVALVYCGLGRKDQTLAWLDAAYETRDEYLVYLKIYPEFQNLHSEPQFEDLERKIGFSQ